MADHSTRSLNDQLIHCAVAGDWAGIASRLAQGADPRHKKSLALFVAAEKGHHECVKLLAPVSDPSACDSEALRYATTNGHAECARLLIPFSDPLLHNKKALSAVFQGGSAEILSIFLACEPLFLTGLDLPGCRDAAIAKGHADLALLLSSIIEQEALAADLPPSASRDDPASRRL